MVTPERAGLIDILTIEGVTVAGVLLVIIGFLLWHIRTLKKEWEVERKEFRKDVRSAREELKKEYESSGSEMRKIIEKYYILSTKVLENLRARL